MQKAPEYFVSVSIDLILDLMSLILPHATLCICLKISSHFYVLGFRPTTMATFLTIQTF